jgi:hypothetical protein
MQTDRPTRVSLPPPSDVVETVPARTVRTPQRLTISYELYADWIRGSIANQFIYDTVGFD